MRRAVFGLVLLAGLALAMLRPAHALMAGALPDTPAAHVDANLPSSPWTSAVAVLVNGGAYSGVVVAPRHVLTAAHVVGAQPATAVSVRINAQSLPQDIAATAIARFPSASFPYDDLALITLAEYVPATVEVLPILRTPLPAQQVITLVGHGASGQGDVGPTIGSSASVKRSGRNVVDLQQTTIDASGRQSLFYLFDFDGPAGNGAWGGPTLGNALETGLAGGDSGSPVFAEIGGQRYLVGINNLVSPAPGSSSVTYRFGTLCGGMLLTDPRFIDWLTAQTQDTLGQSSAGSGDVPLPHWAAGSLAVLLLGSLRTRCTRRKALDATTDGRRHGA